MYEKPGHRPALTYLPSPFARSFAHFSVTEQNGLNTIPPWTSFYWETLEGVYVKVGRTNLDHISTNPHHSLFCALYIPVRIVRLGLRAKQLLLARLIGIVATNQITVFFGLKKRDEMDASPDLLAGELTSHIDLCQSSFKIGGRKITHLCSRIP